MPEHGGRRLTANREALWSGPLNLPNALASHEVDGDEGIGPHRNDRHRPGPRDLPADATPELDPPPFLSPSDVESQKVRIRTHHHDAPMLEHVGADRAQLLSLPKQGPVLDRTRLKNPLARSNVDPRAVRTE